MKIIYILWLRQLKRYIRSRSRIVGSLGQPILFLIALGFGFGPTFQKAGGGDYIQFLAPGIIAMSIIFTAMFSGIEIIWDRQFGFLKELLVAPISRMKIMIGRTLGGATVAVLQGILVLLISMIAGFRPTQWHSIPLALLFMIITAVMFTAIGTAIASLLEDMQGFHLIMTFVVMPVFFLSGAIFPLEGLPSAIKIVTLMDPLTYGVDGIRGALIGVTHFGFTLDLIVLCSFTLVLLAIGSYLFSKIEI